MSLCVNKTESECIMLLLKNIPPGHKHLPHSLECSVSPFALYDVTSPIQRLGMSCHPHSPSLVRSSPVLACPGLIASTQQLSHQNNPQVLLHTYFLRTVFCTRYKNTPHVRPIHTLIYIPQTHCSGHLTSSNAAQSEC